MPPTDIADLMERMLALLSAAAPLKVEEGSIPFEGPKSQSLITPPMSELNDSPRSFADIYGAEGGMLAQLGLDAMAADMPELADLLSALECGLREGAFDVPPAPNPPRRLSPYVYPVV